MIEKLLNSYIAMGYYVGVIFVLIFIFMLELYKHAIEDDNFPLYEHSSKTLFTS